uniref:Protein CYCLOPS n=1 Tax=Pisum sativum TaxID=3888 RepID=CCLOP_PEA|nr:RecName: Full=Protein CYCLOPS; Short=PsCYCLOPS; AltName: Full=Protein IPD3 homolog; Short=PsIPD3; AltName: Full=PsSYM33 [Pisum sativum]ABU63669.1 CYCLOPS [Pisum sativum]
MEGRGFSGLYKNSSEELFLKTVMESPIGMPVPTMEMLGFKTVSQSFRADSEELFKRWLTNEEGYNSTSMGLNSRLSKRISTELVNVSNQQHVGVASEGRNNDKSCLQNSFLTNDVSGDFNFPIREPVDRELQSGNLFLAKAWFLTDQRMTRSRSSELRRRYTEMQNTQAPQGLDSMFMAPKHDANIIKEELAHFNGFDYLSMCEIPSQKGSFMSPSNSSSSTFNTQQLVDVDKVSSCVSMLKGTLQRKRLECQVEKDAAEDGLNEIFGIREPLFQSGFNEGQENWNHQKLVNVQGDFTDQVKDTGVIETLEGAANFVLEGFANQTSQIHGGTASGEPSQSESSAAAPVISSGLDACEGPSNSSQTLCDSSWKQVGESTQNRAKGVREQIMDNLKDDRKRKRLERYGSVTSAVSDDKVDTTKKRRVERSRKMAEAKERNLTPTIPSDMQAVMKRCENLEKEVRSLKLNLSFMNRKDSEQTKQIEDLQKQNEELADEKERLLEEIERLLSETGKI